jgi:Ferritin-like domain
MATTETKQLDDIIASRRNMILLGGTALAGLALAGTAHAQTTTPTDTQILNFALNLEYLEAQYYTLATSGEIIEQMGLGTGAGTTPTGGGTITTKGSNNYPSCKVPFVSSVIQGYAIETALEERKHVSFLRNTLGSSAVVQPPIDLYNSFNGLASVAGISSSGFDPFASDLNFLIGAYIFEDVGVTAYHGAAALISSSAYLDAAAGILAVEAYHAGLVRTVLYGMDQANTSLGIAGIVDKISGVRAAVSGVADVGLGTVANALNGTAATYIGSTIVNADVNTLAYARTTTQVLNIVYASATTVKGGFFPTGLSGSIA